MEDGKMVEGQMGEGKMVEGKSYVIKVIDENVVVQKKGR